MLTLDKIYHAAFVLRDVARRTDLIAASRLNSASDLYLKTENLQVTGSFKVRGAYYKISQLTAEERAKGVIACSAGNHAQGVALAATSMGIKSVVCMPDGAPLMKVESTKRLGAQVELVKGTYDDAHDRAVELQKETGMTFIHPYDDELVIAGQGTIGLEILDQLPDVEAVVVPVGGGGLLVQQAHAVTSVVSLDVNPSIELRVNSREKVVSCQALNQEAQAVLEDMDGGRDLKGVKADVAVNAIVGSLVRCGYLDSLSSAILISVEDKDQARAQRLQQELTSVAGGALGDSQAAVLSQTVQQDKELEKQAKANNISTGKAALIRQAMALNGSLTFEGLAQLSVEELRDLIEAGAPGMPIGMQAALEAAAQYAGLTTADVADADVDPELDETPAHYEVELEVPGHGELEYRVDAYTGQVLTGPANVQPSTPVNPSGDIGMEAAKSAALKHAGLSTAVFTKAERDYDDGRLEYELEFHTDSAAYEVTVDAATGRVLDYEKENLRGGTGGTDIGAQAAKAAALKHAGLSEGQVQELQVEWDSEHGRAVYEVEFKSGGMEYEYVIDAATGAVLDHETERDD